MKVHITNISHNRRGLPISRVSEVSSDRLVLGRGSDVDIQLSDPRMLHNQAVISAKHGGYFFESEDELITKISGNSAASGLVEPGTFIELGPYVILFMVPPDGFDLAIIIERVVPLGDGREQMHASAHRIRDTKISMKAICWVASVLFIFGAIIWPLAGNLTSSEPTAQTEGLAGASASFLLPAAASMWQSGALSPSHRHLGDSCESCHARPFAGVENTSCLSCHEATNHHVDPDDLTLAEIQNGSCIDCHTEHHDGAELVQSSQMFCANCHSDIKNIYESTELNDVGHGLKNHPPFKTTIVTNASIGERKRQPLEDKQSTAEKSNLRFPHHVHVAKSGIRVPGTDDRRNLVCADCHVPDGSGEKMAPIQMEEHCSECHKLEFDPSAKGRELPHGEPASIPALIEDFYLALEVTKAKDRLEYGVSKAEPTGKDTEVHRAIARATERKQQTLDFVFQSVCSTCHIAKKETTKAGEMWAIEPVILSQNWFPKARYDHSAHRSVPCAECHEAQTSKLSSDVLMPKLETCLTCHGDQNETTRVQSTCLTCHAFHLEDLPSFSAVEANK